MQITGKVSVKKYRCVDCGHIHNESTNHYGEIYSACPECSWKPGQGFKHECVETLPEGWGTPQPWKTVKLNIYKGQFPTNEIKSYPLADRFAMPSKGAGIQYRAIRTGEKRAPKKGEWYLSGAIPDAYQARNDLSSEYYIVRIVMMRKVEGWEEVQCVSLTA